MTSATIMPLPVKSGRLIPPGLELAGIRGRLDDNAIEKTLDARPVIEDFIGDVAGVGSA